MSEGFPPASLITTDTQHLMLTSVRQVDCFSVVVCCYFIVSVGDFSSEICWLFADEGCLLFFPDSRQISKYFAFLF